ncbi:MAG: AAA family ATPase [Clostridiales bacterium]|nr:AAA family ATPase [Clostridiales bacterium]
MGRIIAIANQKGGVGKTTTCINLSACLAEVGKKTLVADIDPQGNATSGFGIDKNKLDKTIYSLLIGESYLDAVKLETCVKNLYVIPANIDLAGAEVELIGHERREFLLKRILRNYNNLYDYIFIDCPPSLNLLTVNALAAADAVIVPMQCEYYALEGLSQLLKTIELIRTSVNKSLVIDGLVFTMFDARLNISLQVVDEVKRYISANIYKSMIPRNVRLSEAPSHGVPITLYDSKSKGAESYRILAREIIDKEA